MKNKMAEPQPCQMMLQISLLSVLHLVIDKVKTLILIEREFMKSFNVYLEEEDNSRLLYNEIKNKYDLGTFEEFNDNMTNYSEK